MRKLYQNWDAWAEFDPEQPDDSIRVEVSDPRGWVWAVFLGEPDRTGATPPIRCLEILATPSGKIDRAALQMTPLPMLAEVAASVIARSRAAYAEDGVEAAQIASGQRFTEGPPQPIQLDGETPTPEEFAEAWLSWPDVIHYPDGDRITRRNGLARCYGVTPWAIDKWTRHARDRGLIPKAQTGRGHTKTDSTKGKQP